jgi:hypothetical protein
MPTKGVLNYAKYPHSDFMDNDRARTAIDNLISEIEFSRENQSDINTVYD